MNKKIMFGLLYNCILYVLCCRIVSWDVEIADNRLILCLREEITFARSYLEIVQHLFLIKRLFSNNIHDSSPCPIVQQPATVCAQSRNMDPAAERGHIAHCEFWRDLNLPSSQEMQFSILTRVCWWVRQCPKVYANPNMVTSYFPLASRVYFIITIRTFPIT